jgi:hypothetical protein
MNASKMMARMTMTTQKKNTMIPGMAYPATVLALATAVSYPPATALFERAEQSTAVCRKHHGPFGSGIGGTVMAPPLPSTATTNPYLWIGRFA